MNCLQWFCSWQCSWCAGERKGPSELEVQAGSVEKEGHYEWINWLERKEDVKGEVLNGRRTQRLEFTFY